MDASQQHLLPAPVAHVVDAGAALALVGAWSGVIPVIGGILGAIWYFCQIVVLIRKEFCQRKFNKTARRRANDV